jgi:Family of unknown function (DUF5684)
MSALMFAVSSAPLTTSKTSAPFVIWPLVFIAVLVFEIAAVWFVFSKADQPGWAVIIPFYNHYTLLRVVGRPGWWLIIFYIPVIDFFVWIIVAFDLARSFDRGTAFAIGLIFLPFIFLPILGFGPARYLEPAAGGLRAI